MRRTPAESGRMISASVAGNLAAGLGAEVAWVCMVQGVEVGGESGRVGAKVIISATRLQHILYSI